MSLSLLVVPSSLPPKPPALPPLTLSPPPSSLYLRSPKSHHLLFPSAPLKSRDCRAFSDADDAGGGADYEMGDGGADYEMDDEESEEADNMMDFDPEYEPRVPVRSNEVEIDEEIVSVQSKSFVSTQGWDSEMVVDYRINEDEFHKICLFDCDFFIRRPPDPDNDVYDFREMYVTPPDTDVYSIPKVLAPMPEKYIRCAKSDYGCYNVTEPPVDAPRDPLYKSEREVWKVFLTKHYKNRRLDHPDFVLDFEEIYVIDSKTKSITRARVVVTVPGGRNRDRKSDLLVIRDNGNSFKIIHIRERDDPTTVIEHEEWIKTRQDMERHLRKLRDFNISNWI